MTAAPLRAEAALRQRLREGTANAHARLEAALDLPALGQRREACLALLQGFFGFHRAWEPALAAAIDAPDFLQPRRRLALLRHDLAALGSAPADIEALPDCAAARTLCNTTAAAWGSLYVLEGSTLGGQLITRQLQAAAWWPAQGLRYFHPYGPDTGARWQQTLHCLAGLPAPWAAEVVDGAARTFELLLHWLPHAQPRPAAALPRPDNHKVHNA
ncbi:biliverdin-producing heme oxygenase [Eleftheria terrae]|uniref:biliverdin-producing heme oxygenase n=1 Tax=Eleftheria terrae TaxID=1597781 RepID=UPI00263AFF50|nr:biliverdin-producing heme oxygenase [Eleftheria terrae]WKB53509.1 biliverdin-producing heme oxygenase [Eleftheria terrae]